MTGHWQVVRASNSSGHSSQRSQRSSSTTSLVQGHSRCPRGLPGWRSCLSSPRFSSYNMQVF